MSELSSRIRLVSLPQDNRWLRGRTPGQLLPTPVAQAVPRVRIESIAEWQEISAGGHRAFTLALPGEAEACGKALDEWEAATAEAPRMTFAWDFAPGSEDPGILAALRERALGPFEVGAAVCQPIYWTQPVAPAHQFHKQVLATFAQWPQRPPCLLELAAQTVPEALAELEQAVSWGYAGLRCPLTAPEDVLVTLMCWWASRSDREPVAGHRMCWQLDASAPLPPQLALATALGIAEVECPEVACLSDLTSEGIS